MSFEEVGSKNAMQGRLDCTVKNVIPKCENGEGDRIIPSTMRCQWRQVTPRFKKMGRSVREALKGCLNNVMECF